MKSYLGQVYFISVAVSVGEGSHTGDRHKGHESLREFDHLPHSSLSTEVKAANREETSTARAARSGRLCPGFCPGFCPFATSLTC